jgi:hypothetical protein
MWVVIKHVRDFYKEAFDKFITIRHQQNQDIVLRGGQNMTSQLAELQVNLSWFLGRAVG